MNKDITSKDLRKIRTEATEDLDEKDLQQILSQGGLRTGQDEADFLDFQPPKREPGSITLDTPNNVQIGYLDDTVTPRAKVGFYQQFKPLIERDDEPPTAQESFSAVYKTSDIGEYFTDSPAYRNPLTPIYKPVQDILTDKNTAGIPMNFWHKLLDAVDDNDVQAIRNKIFEDMKTFNDLQRSGWGYTALAFGLGIASPWNFIPMAASVRYAKLSSSVINGAVKNAPNVIASSLGSAFVSAQAHASRDAYDFYNDVLIQSAFGMALSGLSSGIFHSKGEHIPTKTYRAIEASIESNVHGAETKIKINPKGEFDGYQMVRGDSSLSAAKLAEMQGVMENGIDRLKESKLFKYTFGKFATPIIRGLNNTYNVVANLTDMLWDHSFITKRMMREGATGPKAQNVYESIKNRGKYIEWEARQIWEEELEKQVGGVGLLQTKNSAAKAANFPKFQEALDEAFWVGIGDTRVPSSHAVIDRIGRLVREKLYDPADKMLKSREILAKDTSPANTELYMNTIWDTSLINANPQGFYERLMAHWDKGDKAIKGYTKTYVDAKKAAKSARKDYLEFLQEYEADLAHAKTDSRLYKLLEEREAIMEQAEKYRNTLRKDLQTKIDKGEIDPVILKGKPQFTASERKELVSLRKPIRKIEKEIKLAKKELSDIEAQIKKARKDKSLTPETLNKRKDAIKKLDDVNAKFEKAHEKLMQKYVDGKLNTDFVYFTQGKLRLVKPGAKNWFRNIVGDKANEISVQAIDRLLGETPEQMSASALRGIQQGGSNPFKKRGLLVDYRDFDGYLVKDVVKLSKIYADTVGKRVAMHDLLTQFGGSADEGYKSIFGTLKLEHNTKMLNIDKMNISPEKKQRLRTKQKKELDKAEKLIEYQIDLFLGNYGKGPDAVASVANRVKQYNVMSMLGGMAIASIPTILGPLMNRNITKFIETGIVPLLTNYRKTFKKGLANRKDAAEAAIGINAATNAYWESVSGINPNTTSISRAGKTMDYLASRFGNITFSNQLTDAMQIAAWTTYEQKITRLLHDYVGGAKLSTKDMEFLQLLNIEPSSMAADIVKEIKIHGSPWESSMGKVKELNLGKWDNFSAAETMKAALRKAVKMSISEPHPMDIPETLRNPIVGCFLPFKNWIMGATTNYLLTSMQRPDAQKLVGLIGMYALGTMVDPLRQMSRGEEPSFETRDLLLSGVYNSGLLGWPSDVVGTILASMDLDALDAFRSDKFRRRSLAGAIGGPAVGNLENMFRGVEMVFNGTINKKDFKRLKRAMIYNNVVGLNYLLNKGIEATSLPETRAEAERQGR